MNEILRRIAMEECFNPCFNGTLSKTKDADIKKVIEMIKGIGCTNSSDDSLSCANAIAKGLETYLTMKEKEIKQELAI